jgi:hypothetical protein
VLALTELQHRREAEAGTDACPICAVPFVADDMCLTDIEMGCCHAECLAGSPMVYLDTGEPLPTGAPPPEPYRYDSLVPSSHADAELDAALATSPSSPASGVRVKVKPLEWRESETGEAVIADGLTYVVALDLDERGEAYRLFVGSGPDPIGYFNTEGEAKAAAQAHYLSALGEHP